MNPDQAADHDRPATARSADHELVDGHAGRVGQLAHDRRGVWRGIRRGGGPLVRFGVLAVGVAALGAAVLWAGIPSPETWSTLVNQAGGWAPILAVLTTAVLALAVVPRPVMAAIAGVLFGPWLGAVVVLTGAWTGAMAAYAVGRWLGRDLILTYSRTTRADQWIVRQGLLGVVVARVLPLAPFGLISYGYGLTGVPARVFGLGTLIGTVPSTVVYANVGAAALSPGSPGFFVSLAAAGTLAAGGLVAGRYARRRQQPASPVTTR
ncbi:TVP38/TMEM64 family protein [Natronosporangium hydrolyticum]|uniref:TVP38/TMEM64 family membrane protein n=1 Tax=Natronosporangium hydrolyticum TaxID=2811111 RepID=A0A895YQR1_9ACTN|nr:TVP38/TMEM64 family protein [Natronosporangium hydrolyticum]QSB16460.1 TVP38/TMEM64 family protein [Natronosporangium hydrolyticum]